ncbi:rod-binding protein [Natronospira sp.]|uniref:rod-binding protein n=1 Tax=Natronospira sp. TaxID=2024970 RepID=UPI003873176C
MISGDKPVFTDLQGLERLRGKARRDDPEALREVARHFESLFTHMMLQSMRAASFGDDLTGGNEMNFYRDMFDQQIAVEMSQGQGIGLADMIVRELGGEPASASPGKGARDTIEAMRQRAIPVRTEENDSAGAATDSAEDFRPDGPRDFLERLMPAARPAARRMCSRRRSSPAPFPRRARGSSPRLRAAPTAGCPRRRRRPRRRARSAHRLRCNHSRPQPTANRPYRASRRALKFQDAEGYPIHLQPPTRHAYSDRPSPLNRCHYWSNRDVRTASSTQVRGNCNRFIRFPAWLDRTRRARVGAARRTRRRR